MACHDNIMTTRGILNHIIRMMFAGVIILILLQQGRWSVGSLERKHTNGSHGTPGLRLTRHVIPTRYQVHMEPDLERFSFRGSVKIDVNIRQETSVMTLHAADLVIMSVNVTKEPDARIVPVTAIHVNESRETFSLILSQSLAAGTRGSVSITFTGSLNDQLKGFYRTRTRGHQVISKSGRYSAVTQFEATDARRMFPCFDEPDFKATFDISVTADTSLTILSNMPAVREQVLAGDKKRVSFQQTPLMSSYLAAIVVGAFSHRETMTEGGSYRVRVYAPDDKLSQVDFALDLASGALTFYENFLQVPYQLPKLDLVGIPDFAFTAMENWGLITILESDLFVDPAQTSASFRLQTALVICHEIAHQWFGDLVTMDWWSNIWLNEGFAQYMEYVCVDSILPEFDVNISIWQQFIAGTYATGLRLDALHSSHPIQVKIKNLAEIGEVFDDITYNKSAPVIRMLHHYLREADFRSGLTLYLRSHAHGNAKTADLWDALHQVSGQPVEKLMSTWTRQKGFPLITVTEQQEETGRRLFLSQSKFSANGRLTQDESQIKWMIPITVISGPSPNQPATAFLMSDRSEQVVIPSVSPGQWIKLNPDSVAFYRVQYSDGMLRNLVAAVRQQSLEPIDRASTFSDVFALAKAGFMSTPAALRILDQAFREEDAYVVWSVIADALSDLHQLLEYTTFIRQFNSWARRLMGAVIHKIGLQEGPDECMTVTLLRSRILEQLIMFRDKDVIYQLKIMFTDYVSRGRQIPVNIRSPVYFAAAVDAGESEYQTFVRLFRQTDQDEEQIRILLAMASIRNESILNQVIEFSMSGEARKQDPGDVFDVLTGYKMGRDVGWDFVRKNQALLIKRYDGLLLGKIVTVTQNFASEAKAIEVGRFFEDHPFPGTAMAVAHSLESIRVNAAWLERDRDGIKQFLDEQDQG